MNPDLHITVATVVQKDNKFLCVEETSGGKLVINQPAGHVENGESFIEAARRETYEETGWHVEPESLIALYRWQHPTSQETFFRATFCANPVSYDNNCQLDQGIERALWLSLDELQQAPDRLRSPMVVRCIEDHIAGLSYPLDLFIDVLSLS